MGWFENQIKQRQAADNASMESVLVDLVNAVTGGHAITEQDAQRQAANAIAECLAYYGFKVSDPPRGVTELPSGSLPNGTSGSLVSLSFTSSIAENRPMCLTCPTQACLST